MNRTEAEQQLWRRKLKGAIHIVQRAAFSRNGEITQELPIVKRDRVWTEQPAEVETPEAYPGNVIYLEEYRKTRK